MLRPLNDHVVLKEKTQEQSTQSGIILSTKDNESPETATVIAVGDGKFVDGNRTPMQVKVGDEVVFKQYATTRLTLEDEAYLIIKESDILAIVEGN